MTDVPLDVPACLERVRRKDEDAARALVDHLYPLVIRIVRSHLPWRLSEEDLAQDIYLKIFANLDQYRGTAPFEHWVSRVAMTTCLDRLRAQKRRPEWRWADLSEQEADVLDAILSEGNPDNDGAFGDNARELIGRLMETLSPEDRLVITLLDLEQRSVTEIGGITGWKDSAIKVRAHRARKKMRAQLESLENARPR